MKIDMLKLMEIRSNMWIVIRMVVRLIVLYWNIICIILIKIKLDKKVELIFSDQVTKRSVPLSLMQILESLKHMKEVYWQQLSTNLRKSSLSSEWEKTQIVQAISKLNLLSIPSTCWCRIWKINKEKKSCYLLKLTLKTVTNFILIPMDLNYRKENFFIEMIINLIWLDFKMHLEIITLLMVWSKSEIIYLPDKFLWLMIDLREELHCLKVFIFILFLFFRLNGNHDS